MHWPIQPVEIQRRFVPPFCPRRDCRQHRLSRPLEFAYRPRGGYLRSDGRRVPRYRCRSCRATFSKQSFAATYFLKRPELLLPVASALVNGAAHRQIARQLGCAPSTVTRLAARLGRHALLLQVQLLQALEDDAEPLVLDHAESFEGSQDAPYAVATLVGQRSWFCYGFDAATHERTGRRSAYQEARRRLRPRRHPRGGYAGSAARLLETRLRFATDGARLQVTCDDKADYARAAAPMRERIRLEVVPNPERGVRGAPRSAAARKRDAAMFANDLLHGLMRHSLAHHHRETIAFPRRINAGMERIFLLGIWRNLVKGRSERRPDPTTPAMHKGLTDAPWNWPRVFARRLFPDRLPVPRSWLELYRREWTTPALDSNTRHAPVLAY